MTTEFKIIGFTDKITDCDCCGKTNLKGTYCISIEGEEFYYGSTCASKIINVSCDEIKKEVKKIELEKNIDELVINAKSQYKQNEALRTAIKKGISKNDFLLKYGEVIDVVLDAKCYQYGSYTSYINN